MNWGGSTWQFRTHAGLNPACLCCCAQEEPPEEKRGGRRHRRKSSWDNPFLGLRRPERDKGETAPDVDASGFVGDNYTRSQPGESEENSIHLSGDAVSLAASRVGTLPDGDVPGPAFSRVGPPSPEEPFSDDDEAMLLLHILTEES